MSKLNRPAKLSLAEQADRHDLYQRSVQDAEAEVAFIAETWSSLRQRPCELLREDFCGTALAACAWADSESGRRAIGIDLDPEVLAWGRAHNLSALPAKTRARVDLRQANVLAPLEVQADVTVAMNFSYFLFATRKALLEYFQAARRGLVDDGIMILDAYGGYDAPRELEEPRDVDEFTYIWDQAAFNPIDSMALCHIHFEFPDGSRLDKAFTYHWRLWTLPEIRELLLEAGFSRADVYWEGTDEKLNEGNGIYSPAEVGDADAGWVCYIVAQA